ncbi:ribosomal large subunit pseudouridine synthase C [Spiroplasma clarkii]|uniref:RNA pseudouridylate synthase n=1 Tax=Spiroplasma clarkii TaxID=2139 RepID=A0A1Y0L3E9_9MOLU|nr:RluA family pseudouridine synthase [Spiroplasma clarkii]ARU92238.1 ribosomal large subunit pseudouridine synthase C [Spiroplasma clarkii]ATX71558.1 ribosomal large subunit pseudouridine synthase C [Spiroplasma clarkii]
MTILTVNSNDAGQTLFNFIKKNFKATNLSIIYKWFRTNKIKVNGKRIKDHKLKLELGDEVKVYDSESVVKRQTEELVDFSTLEIIYEDENLLIVDKPTNLEMHSPYNICLDLMVQSYLISSNQYDIAAENSFVISHVHRLDKLTQGLVIYAKNKISLDSLLDAIKNKDKIKKYYLVKLTNNTIELGRIHGYIEYSEAEKRGFFSKRTNGKSKECMQLHRWFDEKNNILEVLLISGRKHQIRCISAFYDCPIVGDFKYGAPRNTDKRIGLVAYKLLFKNFTDHLSYLNGKEFHSKATI